MFDKRSEKNELMDDFALSGDALAENLDEMEVFNFWFGGKYTLINALDKIYKRYYKLMSSKKITIADLGCGGGDLLLAVNKWADHKNVNLDIVAIDANSFTIDYARKKLKSLQNCVYLVGDISTISLQQPFDIACLNSVCHHLKDEYLVHLLNQLSQKAQLAIIVNDLRRHWFSYYAIKWITKLFRFSYLAQNDAPLSVLRALNKQEWVNILKQAQINSYQIRRTWAFRWQIIIWCEKN